VARDANEYAELSRGETSLQLAADDAPYWKPERPRLLPPGQRGSGVEIVLLVEDVEAVYRQAQQARADIVRPLTDYPWHMKQFWVRHPDGYLIRPAQRILSVNPTTYRRQVADVFQRDTPRITEELLAVKQTAERLAPQDDVLGAATIYETLVTEIFKQSHLYYHEEAVYDDYYEEEGYYPEEEGLEEFVGESIEALGSHLADEQTFPGVYRSYFENQNGEQALFLYNYEQERGTLYMGDAGWEHTHDVVDGKVAGLMLNRPEQLWLSACWEASGALKAVREQIREERRREHE